MLTMKHVRILILVVVLALLMCACAPGSQMATKPATQTPTQTPTQAPTQAPTQSPTQTPTQAPTQPTTAPVTPTEPAEPEKVLAPDFTVYDVNGNACKLSDYYGKPIILNFWASWCFPCCAEMSYFQEAYEQYGEEVHFLFINLTDGASETVESGKAHIESKGYTFTVLYDTDYVTVPAYKISSIPLTIVLDPEGYILWQHIGSMNRADVKDMMEMIFWKT